MSFIRLGNMWIDVVARSSFMKTTYIIPAVTESIAF